MIYGILVVLVIGFVVVMSAHTKPSRMKAMQAAMNSREVLSDREYLGILREEAKQMRCPHPGYKGQGEPCRRAAGRPCVPGCQGRRNLSTDWHG